MGCSCVTRHTNQIEMIDKLPSTLNLTTQSLRLTLKLSQPYKPSNRAVYKEKRSVEAKAILLSDIKLNPLYASRMMMNIKLHEKYTTMNETVF